MADEHILRGMGQGILGLAFALTLHAFGNAMVVGLIFIICLRMLGLFQTIPYTSLNRLVPIIWAASRSKFLAVSRYGRPSPRNISQMVCSCGSSRWLFLASL